MWMTAELDGMASVHALLPADRARAMMSRLDRAARHLAVVADEERTLAQLRADALCDLVTTTQDASVDAATTAPTTTCSVESATDTPAPEARTSSRTFCSRGGSASS